MRHSCVTHRPATRGGNNSNFLWVGGTLTPTWSGTLISAYWEATGISNLQDIYVDDAL